MASWQSINDEEFSKLYADQYGELSEDERRRFDRYRVPHWKAIIRRSDEVGDEEVFVVSQAGNGGLYFDDVEYGFNICTFDGTGRIVSPGGGQNTLKEAVNQWFTAPQT